MKNGGDVPNDLQPIAGLDDHAVRTLVKHRVVVAIGDGERVSRLTSTDLPIVAT
jgi:hypothetical protein